MKTSFDASTLWSPAMAPGWLIVVLAAYVALDLLGQVRDAGPASALRWRLGAAFGLGTGLWSGQVIGLSAIELNFNVGHHPLGAFAAWVLGVVLSLGALLLIRRQGRQGGSPWAVMGGAAVLSLAVLAGQAAFLLSAGFWPGLAWNVADIAIAWGVAACGLGLGLAVFEMTGIGTRGRRLARNMIAATLCGVSAVLGQHLTTAASGLGQQAFAVHDGRLASGELTLLASVGSILVLLAMGLLARMEARSRQELRRTAGAMVDDAMVDGLTRLPTRMRFEGLLAQAAHKADARRGRIALLFINIDRFKHVNASLGHRAGDALLDEVSRRLRSIAEPHSLARVGGDEFVLLMNNDPQRDDVALRADAVLRLLNEPGSLKGLESKVTCSIGISMYPEDGALSTMMPHADLAMRECKLTGGASYCFFEARMVSGVREQAELLRDLRLAIARKELELLYQPKIHAPTGEITGAEALVRWRHPRRGLVSPVVFIPIAERFGLISEIGNWVVDEACRQARAWRDEGLRMRVAINLSPQQLRDPELGPRIDAALKRHQINPKLLTCEITESVAMQDTQATARFFEVLAGVGVHISIDDFGTGYSSLAYLRKLPAEELKIDRSFVCDLETSAQARTVVEAVVKLGQALKLKVVAEGVETEEQNRILRSLGCDELQGYLFAKPMSAKALGLWAMDDVGPRDISFRSSLFQPTAPAPMA